MKHILHTIAPALLILLFTYAAVSKLADPQNSRRQMHNQPFPPEIADILWLLVPAAELSAAGLLLRPKQQQKGLLLSAILMALFSAYIALVLAGFWDRVPCSCGGVLQNMSWITHLIFNLIFLALATAAWLTRSKGKAENLRKE